jgi:nucleoid-associated protein YgaU
MQEVTCFHCRTVVKITPDADQCTNCGEDLRGLLHPEHISQYFCERVTALAASAQTEPALAEAERGLTYHDLAELRLLAAILAENLGQYNLMRVHVAAIPVDDSLRLEAEWLLRAHQDRQRALREGAKQARYGGESGSAGSTVLADVLGVRSEAPQPGRNWLQIWTGAAAIMIVALLLVSWLALRQREGEVAEQPASVPERVQSQSTTPQANEEPLQADAEAGATIVPAVTGDEASATPSIDPTPDPVDEPTPSVPGDLVSPPTETAAIVDSNPRSVVVLPADIFDLDRFLRETGYPDLAELPIDARLQDGKLILTGIVYLDLQRRQLLDLLESVPGIREVSAVDLLLRPKSTYTVREGDNLWTIVYNIYGDVDRVEEFYLYNIDVAPSPDALTVGEELRVPPIE